MKNIRLESVYPVVEGYKDSIALGAAARFSDPIRLDRLRVSASYSVDDNLPSDELLHAMARWEHRYLYAELGYNRADFYDLFGPTKTSRKGYAAELGLNRSLIYDLPREMTVKADVAYYDEPRCAAGVPERRRHLRQAVHLQRRAQLQQRPQVDRRRRRRDRIQVVRVRPPLQLP